MTLLLFIAVSRWPAQYTNILDPAQLAIARSKFGTKEGSSIEFLYHSTIPAAHIYYPVGAADRRYYVNRNDFNLVYITRDNGRIVNQWFVRTVPMKVEELDHVKRTPGVGTLRKILAGYRRKVAPEESSDRVEKSLNAIKGFAFYEFDYVAAAVWFGYVSADGEFHRDKDGGDWIGQDVPPALGVAFPISVWERADLKKMAAKANEHSKE